MKTTSLIFILLISFISCEYSGVKAAIDSNIFKVLTKIDFNSLLKDKVLIDQAQITGTYIFSYSVDIENFTLTNLTAPEEVKIETGRTHQIRVHLSQIGYPIIGDTVYSNGKNEWGVVGQCLHAKSIKFKHPITGKEMFIEAELPEYFKEIIKWEN